MPGPQAIQSGGRAAIAADSHGWHSLPLARGRGGERREEEGTGFLTAGGN